MLYNSLAVIDKLLKYLSYIKSLLWHHHDLNFSDVILYEYIILYEILKVILNYKELKRWKFDYLIQLPLRSQDSDGYLLTGISSFVVVSKKKSIT